MKSCAGQLVVHRDGSVAYCTEEQHHGGTCAGEDRPHRRGIFACRLVADDHCDYCSSVVLGALR